MNEMRIDDGSRRFLTVILLVCACLVGYSGARANNGDGSGTFVGASASSGAVASTGAFAGTGSLPGAHDGHKGTRSYDGAGFPRDNNDDGNRRTKSYGGAPSGHADRGIKGAGHVYNKNDDGCSKCKWESDDYWERDEPEEEGDENDGDECDDGDDGQYKPDKTHHHAGTPGRGHKPGSRPPGVHKTGPTGVYGDDGVGGRPGGSPGSVAYPSSTGYPGSIGGGVGTTPSSSWTSTPFPGTSKNGYGGVTASVFGTTPSPWDGGTTTPYGFGGGATVGRPFATTPSPSAGTSWSTGAPIGKFPTPARRPGTPWNTRDGTPGHDSVGPTAGFPPTSSSRKPPPSWNVGATSSGQGWGSGPDGSSPGGFPSSQRKPVAPWDHTGSDDGKPWSSGHGAAPGTSGCTRLDSSCDRGSQVPVKLGATPVVGSTKDGGSSPLDVSLAPPYSDGNIFSPGNYGGVKGNQNVPYGQAGTHNTGAYAGATATTGIGSHGVPNFGKKDHPFGFNKPANTQTPYGGRDQTYPSTGSGAYNPGNSPDYNKPGYGSGPHGTWPSSVTSTFGTTKGPYGGIASPGVVPNTQSPGYPTGSDVYGQGVTKPSYGGAIAGSTSWVSQGSQTGSGSTAWHGGAGTTLGSHPGSPGSSTGFANPTKAPFGHASASVPTTFGGPSYGDGTGTKQPGFHFASSSASASASAGASVFGTSPGSGVTGATSGVYSPAPTYGGGSGYPGVKGSPGSTVPPYGTVPHGAHPEYTGAGTWPGKQPGGQHPGSGIAPGSDVAPTYGGGSGYPGSTAPPYGTVPHGAHPEHTGAGTWPGKQPGGQHPGSGIAPGSDVAPTYGGGSGYPGSTAPPYGTVPHGAHPEYTGAGTWPGKRPGGQHPGSGIAPGSDVAPTYGGGSGYPGVKGSPGSTAPPYGTVPHGAHPDTGTGVWPSGRPGGGITPGIANPGSPGSTRPPYGAVPHVGTDVWPGKRPGSDTAPTYGGATSYPGSTRPPYGTVPQTGTGVWPGKQPGSQEGRPWPGGKPADGGAPWPSGRPGGTIAPSGSHPGSPSGNWPEGHPGSGAGCQRGNCGGGAGPSEGSGDCGGGDYYCGGGCSGGGNNAPVTHGLCGGVGGSSGVNKTYYPAGTGDGNVPSIANTYGPNSPFNVGSGAYPATNAGCKGGSGLCNQGSDASIAPEGPTKWNPANPFLYGTGGGTPSDASRPWSSGTTAKPLGKDNPFLDSNWSPKPGYGVSSTNNDGNVIPHGEYGNKPIIGQGNPFLDGGKRRGDVNPNEGVIPLGGKKPEGGPYVGPYGSGGPGGPSYGERPAGSLGAPGSGGYVKGAKDGPYYPGGVSPQDGHSDGYYSPAGNPQSAVQCKLGLFGCGTSGSGSYAPTKGGKHPGGVYGGGGIGGPGSVPGGPGNFGAGASYAGGGNFAGTVGGAQAGTYAGSFSHAQAASSSFAGAKSLSFSGATGSGSDFDQTQGGSWPNGEQNRGGSSNPWASAGASAFASSSSGSWSGSPTNVKG